MTAKYNALVIQHTDLAIRYVWLEHTTSDLLAALENALARMDENPPQKEKLGDLEAVYKNATFYRDREAARAAIAKARE